MRTLNNWIWVAMVGAFLMVPLVGCDDTSEQEVAGKVGEAGEMAALSSQVSTLRLGLQMYKQGMQQEDQKMMQDGMQGMHAQMGMMAKEMESMTEGGHCSCSKSGMEQMHDGMDSMKQGMKMMGGSMEVDLCAASAGGKADGMMGEGDEHNHMGTMGEGGESDCGDMMAGGSMMEMMQGGMEMMKEGVAGFEHGMTMMRDCMGDSSSAGNGMAMGM